MEFICTMAYIGFIIFCVFTFFFIVDFFKFRGAAGASTDKGNKMSKFVIQNVIIFS